MNLRQMIGWWIYKTFRLGPAVVEPSDEMWGHEPATYAPEQYGNYIATSVAVYACANYRAKNLAKLPLRLWKTNVRGKRTEVTSGQAYELLTKVNPYWTFGRLIRMTELARCLWGSAYWCLERGPNGKGIPREIWWARPDKMRVLPDRVNYLAGFVYEDRGERIPFLAGEAVWLRQDNPIDEYSGLSPIAAARLSIDLGTAGLRSNKNLFDQGLQLGGIISPESNTVTLTPEQVKELEAYFEKRFKGVGKAHRWAVLSGGVKATPIGVNPKDAEFINQMKWSLNDVARVYFIPPELVGDHEHATYSNVDQAYKAVWNDCLIPEAVEIAEEITEQLLPLFGGEVDVAEFDFSGIPALQEDRGEIVDQMYKLWQMGVPLNRLLEEFQPSLLPPGGGYPWGDVGYAPMTLLPAGQAPAQASGQPAEATPQEQAARALRLLQDLRSSQGARAKTIEFGSAEHERIWKAFTRRTDRQEERVKAVLRELFRRQQESVLARLSEGKSLKVAIEDDPFDRAEWGKKFKQGILPLFRDILDEAGNDTMDELAISASFDVGSPEAVRFLERRAQRFARHVNEATWTQLKESLGEGMDAGESIPDLMERVRSVFAEATTSRAETIARTEVIGASNGGALLAAKQSGVVEAKEWLAALDERTRETHVAAHGQRVGLDEDFEVGAGSGPAPGQIGLPEEDINCRCTVTWVLSEKSIRRNGYGELVEVRSR